MSDSVKFLLIILFYLCIHNSLPPCLSPNILHLPFFPGTAHWALAYLVFALWSFDARPESNRARVETSSSDPAVRPRRSTTTLIAALS
jgi:hypothetical protein